MANQLYKARIVMPMSSPLIENGAILVRDNKIIAVGRAVDLFKTYSSSKVYDLGEVILLPGLINAHCHLEYGMMKNHVSSANGFTGWIQEIVKIKASLEEKDFVTSIIEGAKELRASGCTTVVNTTASPELLSQLPTLSLRCWHLLEVMDIRGAEQRKESLRAAENFFQQASENDRLHFGISPHAPQTTSKKLYAAARDFAQKKNLIFSTHLAESEEEVAMFTQRSGQLFQFLKDFAGCILDSIDETPVKALLKNNLLPKGALLVHMNFLSEEDRQLLSQQADNFFIIHCPGTHRFFERPSFDLKFFRDHGFSVSLGTDSLASNNELNLFSEMQIMAAAFPQLAPEEILAMVTLNPAAAIAQTGRLGELSTGAVADFITIPFTGSLNESYAAVVNNSVLPVVF